MPESNAERLHTAVEAWNSGDLAGFLDHFAPDVVWIPYLAALEATEYRGHADLERLWNDVRLVFADFRIQVTDVIDLGDRMVATSVWHGIGRGSELEMNQEVTQIFELGEDGRATKVQGFHDRRAALEAAGVER